MSRKLVPIVKWQLNIEVYPYPLNEPRFDKILSEANFRKEAMTISVSARFSQKSIGKCRKNSNCACSDQTSQGADKHCFKVCFLRHIEPKYRYFIVKYSF